jgi:hypothetical protein
MKKRPVIHALQGFQLTPAPGPGGPYVLMTTGCRTEDPRTLSDPVMHTVGMRVKQARELAAALLEVSTTAEATNAE